MPIKKDGTGKRWVEMQVLLAGSPEEIWRAMATGPGYATWFTPAEIEEKVGGKLRFVLGPGMISTGEVTIWEPPVRFGYVEREWNGDAPPVATEVVIESRAGGMCVVRMVHSLFATSDDWDDQMEGFENGWPAFFAVLRLYLAHHAGKPGASTHAVSFTQGDALDIWTRLMTGLGLANANVGESRTLTSSPQAVSGVVEQVTQDARQRHVLLRLNAPAPGTALIGTYSAGGAQNVSAMLFFYGDGAEAQAAASQEAWQTWISATFPGEAKLVC